jgi:hypothetical protein
MKPPMFWTLSKTWFRSHDPIINDLLHAMMRGSHDTKIIKTNDNQWNKNNIITDIQNYIRNAIFQRHDSAAIQTNWQMFFVNIHFGQTGNPDNNSHILHNLQILSLIKKYDLTKISESLSYGSDTIWFFQSLFPLLKTAKLCKPKNK